MATAYDYYRTNYPGWGTTQLQFSAPPTPNFQPLPSWSGYDYYRAHAYNPDYGLYSSVMNRARDSGYGGFDTHEAKVWQRRVYSGLVNLAEILPSEIGAAAAYEAYRMWKHHRAMLFDPLGGASEREREALMALATGEATRLWSYSGRAMDTYGQRDCLESAAATASRIASTVFYNQGYAGSGYGREYGYGDTHRGRRYSNVGQPIIIQQGTAAPMPIPGAAGTGYPGSSPYAGSMGGSPYLGGGVPAYAGSYGGGGYAGGAGGYVGSAPGYAGSGGIGSAGGFVPPPLSARRSPSPFLQPGGMAGSSSPYMGAATAAPYTGGYSASAAYPGYGQTGYGQSRPGSVYHVSGSGTTTIPATPGSTIIISKGHSRRDSSGNRHHRHSFSGIRRARSADMRY